MTGTWPPPAGSHSAILASKGKLLMHFGRSVGADGCHGGRDSKLFEVPIDVYSKYSTPSINGGTPPLSSFIGSPTSYGGTSFIDRLILIL